MFVGCRYNQGIVFPTITDAFTYLCPGQPKDIDARVYRMSWISKIFRAVRRNRGMAADTKHEHGAPHNNRPPSPFSVIIDNPIERVEDDILGRADVARSFADQVLASDSKQGLVVGVLGPWGS